MRIWGWAEQCRRRVTRPRVIAQRNSTEVGRGPRSRGRSSSVRDRLTTLSRDYWRFVRKQTTPHLERRLDRAPTTPSSRDLGRRVSRVLRAINLAVDWCHLASDGVIASSVTILGSFITLDLRRPRNYANAAPRVCGGRRRGERFYRGWCRGACDGACGHGHRGPVRRDARPRGRGHRAGRTRGDAEAGRMEMGLAPRRRQRPLNSSLLSPLLLPSPRGARLLRIRPSPRYNNGSLPHKPRRCHDTARRRRCFEPGRSPRAAF